MSRRLFVPLVGLVVVFALALGVAWAQWTSGSVPGGNGAAAAATLERGGAPTAVVAGRAVTVSWAASTLSDGDTVTGYLVKRFDATTLAAATVLTACAGTVLTTSCTESALPSGTWVYSVTPVAGTYWTGAESATSNAVTTDGTPPVNAITAAVTTGGAFADGDTVFYRGVAGGSLTLTNSVTDAGSGPAASTTSALTGTATGWNHTPSTVSSPSGGPYVSNPFSWTAGTTSAPTDVVTGRDGAGNQTATTVSFVDDSTAPTAGTVAYPDGYQPGQSVVVTVAAGTDGGSGIATRQLQRSAAVLDAGSCGTFSSFSDVGPDGPTSDYTDAQVTDGSCYRYRYVVTDQVGNQDIATSSSVAEVDSSAGGPALRSAKAFSVLAATGVVNSGATNLSGDLGLSPSGAITGFPPGTVGGAIHDRDAAAAQGQSDLVNAYNDAAARTPTGTFSGDLNGRTFHPGVYQTGAALALTGSMTLDGAGDSNSLFVFQVGAAMNTAASSQVVLANGAQASHVFWQVLGAVTTGGPSSMAGTIMAAGAITLGAGTQLIGRALSEDTVTLSGNAVRFTTALPPVIAIDGGASAATKDVTPTITGTTNALTGSPVQVTVNGQVLTTTVQAGGMWGVTAATLPAGSYAVVASVKDAAGNGASVTQNLTVEVNPDPVALQGAATFSVLAATGVVNSGATNLSGDLGLSPSGAISGFPPGTVGGAIHDRDAAASQGQSDLATAYHEVAARTPHAEFSGDLQGRTFHIGIYHTTAAMALTGTMTLDAEGNPNAVFIFQVGAAMNTAASSQVVLTNGAQASNVFWVVAGAVTTGESSSMAGTIMAAGAITLGAGTQLVGRALSQGTVTLSSNPVTTG